MYSALRANKKPRRSRDGAFCIQPLSLPWVKLALISRSGMEKTRRGKLHGMTALVTGSITDCVQRKVGGYPAADDPISDASRVGKTSLRQVNPGEQRSGQILVGKKAVTSVQQRFGGNEVGNNLSADFDHWVTAYLAGRRHAQR